MANETIIAYHDDNNVPSPRGHDLGHIGQREDGEWVLVIQPGLKVQTRQDVLAILDALDQFDA